MIVRLKRRITCLVCSGVIAFPLACSDEGDGDNKDDSSKGTVNSGLAEDRMVSSLSAVETKQVSASFNKAIEESGLIDGLCTLSGVVAMQAAAASGQSATSCEQVVAECKSAPSGATQSGVAVNDEPSQLTQCSVTVGELEACLTAQVKALKQAFSNVTCDSEIQMVTEAISSGLTVTQCQVVQTSCPQVLPGMADK